jgi:CRP/FNR family transcriptional regulator, dissimilatory nitrate respiration regulator
VRGLLAQLPLLSRSTPEQIDRLACVSARVDLGRGEVLFHAGDPSTALFAVVAGQVKLTRNNPDGAEKIIELVGPGQTFGEAVVFVERSYPVTAVGLQPTRLVRVPTDVVLDLVENDPTFARRMLAGMAVRLHGLVNDVAAVSLRSGSQRVVGFLLGLVDGEPAPGTTVTLPAAKAVVASRLSLTPETLSRTLRDLSDAGLVRVSGRTVVLLDPASLVVAGATDLTQDQGPTPVVIGRTPPECLPLS